MIQLQIFNNISVESPVIAWWSGGADSAVTCWLCIMWFGAMNVRIVFIDNYNEDDDVYRFKQDCEKWYGVKIETISSKEYNDIEDVWTDNLSLNTATGAICSTIMKLKVRQAFQMRNDFSYQAFGFDVDELNRAIKMKQNYSECNPIFPLVYELYKKGDAMKVLKKFRIEPPLPYRLGYRNNNCFNTGCVQGGIGYWQKLKNDFPEKVHRMAMLEHKLTDLKGEPVTCLKDQSKGGGLVFLEPHPNYPNMKDLSMMKGRAVEPLIECNGFCGAKINDS